MTDKKYLLEWVPLGEDRRIQVPYTLSRASGKLVYSLDPDLPFGRLLLNDVDITGYFKPDDGDTEYTCRPRMFTSKPEETLAEPTPETDETPAPEDD